ncbi:MAG: InlB B-repeat-containing protein, partial [Spirochaetales bacterium]|nr:InlB B-repeat-containing protein [Spirochaetales bacterium]
EDFSYIGPVTDYTLSPANGTELSVSGNETETQSVTVTAGNCEPKQIPITVKPVWTVTFVKDADDNVNGTFEQKVVHGKKAAKPDDPVKIGYTFNGWYEENVTDTSYDFNKIVSKDITLYAKLTANTYKMTLNNDGYTSESNITYDTFVPNITKPTKIGYTFGGYYLDDTNDESMKYIDEEGQGCHKWDVTNDAILIAKWTANTYTIVFKANNDGTDSDVIQDMTYDVSADLLSNTFTKFKQVFKGWGLSPNDDVDYNDKQNVKNLSVENGAKITLYALWRNIDVGDICYQDGENIIYSESCLSDKTPIGVVFYVTTDKVKIVHLKKEDSVSWCKDAKGTNKEFGTDTADGSGNWQIICNTAGIDDATDDTGLPSKKYPAFRRVNSLGEGWYLPAKGELDCIYNNKTIINNKLTLLKKSDDEIIILGNYTYWSSSADGTVKAWYQNFNNGDKSSTNRGVGSNYVRGVRAF